MGAINFSNDISASAPQKHIIAGVAKNLRHG
jgi:hypothetical protein